MKRIAFLTVISCFAVSLFAQSPADGSWEVSKLPWNGYFMPTTKDQMVHGEDYRGYPGPLPKFFRVLGMDANHPGVDTELLHHVDREVPGWWGACNGWAVSAIKYEEPQSLVARGIKFFPGDLKAILANIYKANTANFFGVEDQSLGGLTPDSVERVLFDWIADRDHAVIFDEDISDQVWNYPVASFTRQSTQSGEWTDVTLSITYTQITPLSDATGTDVFLPYDVDYYYRYKTETGDQYQWVGPSITNHPQRAWLDKTPYHKGAWLLNANHFYYLDLYERLLDLSAEEDARVDMYEPNGTLEAASPLGSEFILASLYAGDDDFFSFSLAAGEALVLEAEVYNGYDADLSVSAVSNQGPLQYLTLSEGEPQTLTFTAPTDGDYFITLAQAEGAFGETFYSLKFSEETGYVTVPPQLESRDYALLAINTREEESQLHGADTSVLPANGSFSSDHNTGGQGIRASRRTVWVESSEEGDLLEKRYHRDHFLDMPYVVPHLTFKNGWDTVLDVRPEDPGQPVLISVFDTRGILLEKRTIPFPEGSARFKGPLSEVLHKAALVDGAWFRLSSGEGNRLRGVAGFVSGIGQTVWLDLQARPRIGELLIFDLKPEDQGSTGLALVNTSSVPNEVLYRVVAKNGEILDDGFITLAPGAKWLTSASALSEDELGKDLTLYLHAQYPVEGLVVQYRKNPLQLYGHRILSVELDQIRETYIALPEERARSEFLFANYNTRTIHALFEGYAADGSLQGRFNIELGNPLKFKEVRRAPLTQILQNGVGIQDLNAITHFRMTTVEPVYVLELYGQPGSPSPTAVPLPHIFENP